MSRSLHRLACLALLGVLSGAPAVAVICAELCAPGADQEQTTHGDSSCHGRTGTRPAVTSQPDRDCGDHGATVGALASVVTNRSSDLAVMHPVDVTAADGFAPLHSSDDEVALAGRASPPLPARSSRILRI